MAPPTTLTDLPPELLDHVTTYFPTARSVRSLGSANKLLHAFVEKDAWQTFARTRFPSLNPTYPPCHKDVARSLTTLSRAWDRRAFVARYTEPSGDILALPANRKLQRWTRPTGQTIGFTPQLDSFEVIGPGWQDRREVLAFSAGTELCVRERQIGGKCEGQNVHWKTYKPFSAVEGRDDITSLHLLRPREGEDRKDVRSRDEITSLHLVRPQEGEGESQAKGVGSEMITGTARGDLQLLDLSEGATGNVKTYYVTQGLPVRFCSLLQQQGQTPLLAANLGDTRINLYPVDATKSKIVPLSSLEIQRPTNGHRTYRAWSINFISSSHLAVGLGPSEEPIHIYSVTPSGLSKDVVRKFSLQNNLDRLQGEITLAGFAKKTTSSVYPVVSLPPSSSGGSSGQVFLSGAYDGIIRLHDLRSNQEVEQAYVDPTDDSAIYSLLPRGQETLVAGTSRHSLLKVFDLRLGAKAYTYLEATNATTFKRRRPTTENQDWNLFLKPSSATYPGRGGGNNWARRSAESSVYSLTSPSPHSPYIYAGVENNVVEMAFTGILDPHPDPVFFPSTNTTTQQKCRKNSSSSASDGRKDLEAFKPKEVLDLAMYDQCTEDLTLRTQRSLWETLWVKRKPQEVEKSNREFLVGLDERWRLGGS